MKAVIVDIKGKYAAALTEDGEVKRIVNDHYEIGDTMDLCNIQEVKKPHALPRVMKRTIAVAAALAIMTVGGMATAYAIPYGTVSLDADSSIEYTINCFDYVIGVKALNDDGETVLSEIDENALRHHKIDDAIHTTVNQMEKDGYPDAQNGLVEINVNTPDNDRSNRLKENLKDRFNSGTDQPAENAVDLQAGDQKPDENQNHVQEEHPNGNAPQSNTPQEQNEDIPETNNGAPQQNNASAPDQSFEPSPNTGNQGNPAMR